MEDLQEQRFKEIDAILTLTKGNAINISYALLQMLESAPPEEQSELLKYVAEHFGIFESSEEIPIDVYINDNQLSTLKARYSKVVDSMFEMILASSPPVEDFYRSFNSLIIHNSVFEDDQARAFAMYWILIDRRIPYFELGQGLKISNEEWQAISKKLRLEKTKIRFILATNFTQRSEGADLLLKVIDSPQYQQERVYLFGYTLELARETERRAASQT